MLTVSSNDVSEQKCTHIEENNMEKVKRMKDKLSIYSSVHLSVHSA